MENLPANTGDATSVFSAATTLKPESENPPEFYITTTRIVKEIPKKYLKAQAGHPPSKLDKLKRALRPPVVKKYDQLPNPETVTYHVNEKGEIIMTKKTRVMSGSGIAGGMAMGTL